MSQSHDNSPDTSVDSEDDFRPCNCQRTCLRSLQLTVGLYEHPAKDGTTEAAKTMVNTLNALIRTLNYPRPTVYIHSYRQWNFLPYSLFVRPEELLELKVSVQRLCCARWRSSKPPTLLRVWFLKQFKLASMSKRTLFSSTEQLRDPDLHIIRIRTCLYQIDWKGFRMPYKHFQAI